MQTPEAARTPALLSDQQRTKKFVVPIYQRLFVWGEIQIKTLLDDLKEAMNPDNPYYIGVITVVEKSNQWEIVDGQQRLTFLTLFGCECVRRGFLSEKWQTFIYFDDGAASPANKKTLRINYFGRKEDETDIERLLSDAPNWSIVQVKNANFRLFYDCFERLMKSFSTDKEKIKLDEKGMQFVQYVFEQASFLISELPSTYSPLDLNLFFEKMNAAGRQLEPVDIVKGKYFPAYATIWNDCMNVDREFKDETPDSKEEDKKETILDIIHDRTSQVKEESDDRKDVSYNRLVMKPAVFLLHVLRLSKKGDNSLDPSRLLETFADHVPSVDRESFVKTFLSNMKQYRTWLDKNIVYLKRGADGSFEYLFRTEQPGTPEDDNQRTDPKVFGDTSKDRMMKQFQSMLYVSNSDSQEWVLAMFKACNMGQATLDLKTLKAWENNEKDYKGSKDWDYWTINRYWFWKLDYILWEKVYNRESLGCDLSPQEKEAIEKYVFRRNRSIEHLHPQTSADGWDDKDLHGFGNLAMISEGFNSQQSNDTVGTKFGRMTDKINIGDLESIKLLLMFRKAEGEDKQWTPDVAEEHAQEMHEILDSYYQKK